jgi:hypothetical protein
MTTREQKQKYLYDEIQDMKYDPELFKKFLAGKKNLESNLENWTIEELEE